MGWEQRGSNRYYYQKRRQGGHCVSEYLGAGPMAQLLAACEQARRAEDEMQRQVEQERRRQREHGSQALAALAGHLRAVTRAVLLNNGYHQHKRQWRKCMSLTAHPGEGARPVPSVPVYDPSGVDQGLKALQAALDIKPQPTGKRGVVTQLDEVRAEQEQRAAVRQVLHDYPCIWGELRNRVAAAEPALMKVRGNDPSSASGQITRRTVEVMRVELGHMEAPLLEKMLIEHVALAWLDLDTVQVFYGQNTAASHERASGVYWDRRLSRAQQRYLRAVETLARVRRLAQVTPLQVNIGGQQVNVAGGGQA